MASGHGPIDVRPLAEAFIASGLPASEVANRMGWMAPKNKGGDGRRLLRAIGLALYNPGHGLPCTYRKTCTEATAIAFARAMNLYPRDLGF